MLPTLNPPHDLGLYLAPNLGLNLPHDLGLNLAPNLGCNLALHPNLALLLALLLPWHLRAMATNGA
jgi:hypothetical protein